MGQSKITKTMMTEINDLSNFFGKKLSLQSFKHKSLIDFDKRHIINIFMKNIKSRRCVFESENAPCGYEGNWLEKQLGLKPNCKNEPDILGYEMKKYSKRISFGDFSASEYLFSKRKPVLKQLNNWDDNMETITRDQFIEIFGNPNGKKNNRYSWSGSSVPKYNIWNDNGQKLSFNRDQDLFVIYSFKKDKRECKETIPDFLKKKRIIIVFWEHKKLKHHIENKFNNKGFFICTKKDDVYDKILFGKPFDYNHFVECMKNSLIVFDSGMYVGNSRNYSHFRSSCRDFWNNLIIEEYS